MPKANAKGAIHLVGARQNKVARYDLDVTAFEVSYRKAWGRVEL